MRVTIEKLVYGGDGLARTPEGVVFVPRTAPGDVVDIEVLSRKKDYAVGRVLSLLEASADRQAPYCPNYETAGCCHWQHIRYERQVEFKEAILRETLWRAGRIEWKGPIARLVGPDRGDRMRATFHVREGRVGFMREKSHTIEPILECSALAPALNEFIPEANAILAAGPDLEDVTEIRVVTGENGSVASSFVSDGAPRLKRLKGSQQPRVVVNGFPFDLDPDTFFQPNRFLFGDFMNAVLEAAGGAAERTLELYCGSGFFSLPLARRSGSLIGVDVSREAIRQARENARANDVRNADFVEGDLDLMLGSVEPPPDLIMLDPPRTGCGVRTAQRVAALKARRIVYVSCNPSTFSREAAVFLKSGYVLTGMTLVDQFPNTYHIETIGVFEREAEALAFGI